MGNNLVVPKLFSTRFVRSGYWLLATGYWLLATGYWLTFFKISEVE
jgi:hypothetical protein